MRRRDRAVSSFIICLLLAGLIRTAFFFASKPPDTIRSEINLIDWTSHIFGIPAGSQQAKLYSGGFHVCNSLDIVNSLQQCRLSFRSISGCGTKLSDGVYPIASGNRTVMVSRSFSIDFVSRFAVVENYVRQAYHNVSTFIA